MEPFTRLSAVAAPLMVDNIDTDTLFPGAFIRRMDVDFARALFANWRFEGGSGQERTDFVLNRPRYRDARILVSGWNFGCGSSREHAVWALAGYGIRCVIAKSFGDIFFDNCSNNGLLAIELPEGAVDELAARLEASEDAVAGVDLEAETVGTDGRTWRFQITAERRDRLLRGLDDIELTLSRAGEIDRFGRDHFARHPWIIPAQRETGEHAPASGS